MMKGNVVKLVSAEVKRLELKNGGTLAWARTPDDTEYRFWVTKKNQPLGSRRWVGIVNGVALPVIQPGRAVDFSVGIGSEVMLVPGQEGETIFPVISAHSYRHTVKKIESLPKTPAVFGKGKHRFVD